MKIVVDTSALVAILGNEPERRLFSRILARADPLISAGTLIETSRVVQLRFGSESLDRLDRLLASANVITAAVGSEQVGLARDGLLRFGKGRGIEPALLNFGDLFAYALARAQAAPLLYKGSDFDGTDVTSAAALFIPEG